MIDMKSSPALVLRLLAIVLAPPLPRSVQHILAGAANQVWELL